MRLSPIGPDHAGIDRKQLLQVKARFLTLNQARYQRTLAALGERQQEFLTLLPLLFHVNHPILPGYVSQQTPCGLYGYEPDKSTLRLAQGLARSFRYKRDLIRREHQIDALFVMGSIGTIAQSDSSDLDIWVCFQPGLGIEQRRELHAKCQQLSHWAEQQLRLEVHFFPMDPQAFQRGELAALSTEASGSTQRYLLLDEFYRTALWLGGKLPLWWFVPASHEAEYSHYRELLLERLYLRAEELIDFGPVAQIPTSEFIGAGIWQLYKGIEAPHKSILKLLLLETYASDAQAQPLALVFKAAVYDREPEPDPLDAYVMVYRQIEHYLHSRAQFERLELVRRCFYFKADKPLTRAPRSQHRSWQRQLLEQLVSEWHWPAQQLQLLDSRSHWKAPYVLNERNQLVNELSNSYRLLSGLAKSHPGDSALSSEELLILGRKLHAAFERKAGKIDWINPGISRDLYEQDLCLLEELGEDQQQSGWLVYRGSLAEVQRRLSPATPVKRSRHLLELLLWCYANGLLTRATRVDIQARQFQLSAPLRQQLLHSLQRWLPLPLPPLAHNAFTQGARAEKILLLFNLGGDADPGGKRRAIRPGELPGAGRTSPVHSCDLVQLNSWQELVCRHYPEDALVNSLLHCLRLAPPGGVRGLPELTIECLGGAQSSSISQRLEELWRDLSACYYSGARPPNTRYLLQAGDEYLLLQFLHQQPQLQRFKSYPALLDKLASAQTSYSPLVIDRGALADQPLKLYPSVMHDSGIYVFYQLLPGGTQASLQLVDERGSLFSTEMPFHNPQTLLRPLHRFIRAVLERQDLDGDLHRRHSPRAGALMPVRFYEVLGNCNLHSGHLDARNVTTDLRPLSFANIQVIAEPGLFGGLSYTIYCDQREFTELDHGDRLFDAVARHILSLRRHGERYPCYITDLDLSLCRDLLAPQTGLQLLHYLQIKAELEQRLNRALLQL